MRAACVADIHGNIKALYSLKTALAAEDIDSFFILGDFSRGFKDKEENKQDIQRVLEALGDYRVYALPGNCDQLESVQAFKAHNANLHNVILKLPELNIIGLGGSNPTPFGTPYELSEQEIGESLKALGTQADGSRPTIVMSHCPPKDTRCDAISSGAHVGSQALRDYIENKQPELVLCSHIHEAGGLWDQLGKSRILNLGRISEGRAYILSTDEGISVEAFRGIGF